jgi:hypothetical protein
MIGGCAIYILTSHYWFLEFQFVSTTMSMPTPEQYGGPPPAYTDKDAELVFGTPPPVGTSVQPLQLPICLPQITGGYDSPFARGYSPQLAAYGLGQDDFLNFLDSLNIAMVSTSHVRPKSNV